MTEKRDIFSENNLVSATECTGAAPRAMDEEAAETIADITNGLMAIPNCISLIVLSGLAARHTKDYLTRYPTFESEEE